MSGAGGAVKSGTTPPSDPLYGSASSRFITSVNATYSPAIVQQYIKLSLLCSKYLNPGRGGGGGKARTRDKRTFALSALKSDFCIHPERVRQRNHKKSLSLSWPRGCKREQTPPRSSGRKLLCRSSSGSAPKGCSSYVEQKRLDLPARLYDLSHLWKLRSHRGL